MKPLYFISLSNALQQLIRSKKLSTEMGLKVGEEKSFDTSPTKAPWRVHMTGVAEYGEDSCENSPLGNQI